MRVLKLTLPTPQENLALEEALLDHVERGLLPELLRIWESPVPFVVLGIGQEFSAEVHEATCREAGIPVLRRCSAGGCVLQGPGCLNYSLFAHYEWRPNLDTIRGSYTEILGALSRAFSAVGLALEHEGTSDLALSGMKVSGNAQKRRRNAFLHHGTILYNREASRASSLVTLAGQCLREPLDRPDYRGHRPHGAFMGVLPLDRAAVESVLLQAFDGQEAAGELEQALRPDVERLVRERYGSPEWTRRH